MNKKLLLVYFLASILCFFCGRNSFAEKKNYNFSHDWVSSNISLWENMLSEYKNKEDVQYLEIGVFEGRSLIWMLENVLTSETAHATAIDFFPDDLYKIYTGNLELSGAAHKVTTLVGYSNTKLRELPFNTFNIIYIDASHTADDIISDAVLSFTLLKEGGIIIFDDYLFNETVPKEIRPKFAIDVFITAYRNYLEVIHRGPQLFIKKNTPPSYSAKGIEPWLYKYFSLFGQYIYNWNAGKLFLPGKIRPIIISKEENKIIQRLLLSRKEGETEINADNTILKDKKFIQLKKKLNLLLKTNK